MQMATENSARFGVVATCDALGLSRASFYRRSSKPSAICAFELAAPPTPPKRAPRASPRALTKDERIEVLNVLHEERFVDIAPKVVYAILLDEKRHLCSSRTMYRILADAGEVHERRSQLSHVKRAVPRLVTHQPNEVWTWDITHLPGPTKHSRFYLYVILDLFSRYVVGWLAADRECATLASRLLRETCERHDIQPGQLTTHADRGAAMTSKAVSQLFADLGVTRSHSRPRTSNDNAHSEAQFKTMKYRPGFPVRFDTLDDVRTHATEFFDWYNTQHRHSGIAMLTPHHVFTAQSAGRIEERALVLASAYEAHPERFPNGAPSHPKLHTEVWINRPINAASSAIELHSKF